MQSAEKMDAAPTQLAPSRMLSTLLLLLIAVYSINTLYNLTANTLRPLVSLIQAGSPVFGVMLLSLTLLFVVKGKTQVGISFLAGGVSLLSIIGYPTGQVTYQLTMWNQIVLLVVALPFTSHPAYRRIGLLVTLTVVVVCSYILVTTNAYSSAETLSQYMRSIVVGLCIIIMAYVMYRVQGILFEGQRREWSARMALTEIKQTLERTVDERTQALIEANQKLSRQNALLTSLHETRIGVLNHLDLRDLMQSILASNLSLLDAQESVIHLTSADGSRLELLAGTPLLQRVSELPNIKGEGMIGKVWSSGQVLAIADYATWPDRDPGAEYDAFHACIAAPLVTDDKVMGVMAVVRTVPDRPFTADEIDMHVRLAQIASVAYDNSRLYAEVRASERMLESRVEERTRSLQQAVTEIEVLREKSIADATASERSRLARELHDSVSQAIYGISLGARAAQKIRQMGEGDLDQSLSYIVSLSETALAEIRALIFEMKPESLSDEGIKAAINKHADVLRHRHNHHVTIKLPETEPATTIDVKYALYRVMQEATHNIIKHAYARNIFIELHEAHGFLVMSVRDDGCGFEPALKRPGHHGLGNMEERIRALGGSFAVETGAGKGTCLMVRVPRRLSSALPHESLI
jgi:signal transduction histidine kinase